MADVINKNTMEIHRSVNTPDFQEPEFMIINGKTFPLCEDKYWKIVGDEILEMSDEEKSVVDYIPPPPEQTAEQIAQQAAEVRRINIKTGIEKIYPFRSDELQEIRLILAEEFPNNERAQAYNAAIEAILSKYPKE